MKQATPALPSPPSPFADSEWFDPLEEAVRSQVRSFIEEQRRSWKPRSAVGVTSEVRSAMVGAMGTGHASWSPPSAR